MKNIHVLATDKPSRLYISDYGKELNLSAYPLRNYTTGQHIYITNSEEIKIGDYYYLPRTNSVYKCIEDPTELNLERRLGVAKIILTTDQDLIKDGVQAIDDEFLEWFVKNPSCESVEVADIWKMGIPSTHDSYQLIIPEEEPRILTVEAFNKAKISYKEPKQDEIMERFIANAKQQETLEEKLAKIVSKEPSKFWTESDERARIREEKKQHLIDMMKSDEELGLYEEPKTKCYCGHTTYCDCGPEQHVDFINSNIDEFDKALKLSKQETLEEVAENSFLLNKLQNSTSVEKAHYIAGFREGVKWQQEQSYSKEEVEFIKTLIDFYWSNYNNEHPNNLKDFELSKSILETFKKK